MIESREVNYDVIIAGGGLAGLVSGILLGGNGFRVLLLEKKKYPFNKVCGEYVSNEVLSFLISMGFDPFKFGASKISRLRMSDTKGRSVFADLDLGGFGLSRYLMDDALAAIALNSGVEIIQESRVNNIIFRNGFFDVEATSGEYTSHFVIGAYGKRDLLDKKMQRKFIEKHTGYLGVKYHVKLNYPSDEIGLDHFPGGYCGVVKIEEDKFNLCYLYKRRRSDEFRSITELEEKILFRNPALNKIFNEAGFVSETPEVISEICFDTKGCISEHIMYCGDAAGLITPLCGNGMAMAIHGALLLSSAIISVSEPGKGVSENERKEIEDVFNSGWEREFSKRLFWGRQLQKLSGKAALTSSVLWLMQQIPSLNSAIIRSTHGREIKDFIQKSNRQLHQTSHP